jgi:hypothetical protein
MRRCWTRITAALLAFATRGQPTLRTAYNIIRPDLQILKRQIYIQAIQFAEQEGMMRHDRLFPEKGRFAFHEEVLEDLRIFEEWRWAKWEDSIVDLSKEETTRSY